MKYKFTIIILSVLLLNSCYTVVNKDIFRMINSKKEKEINSDVNLVYGKPDLVITSVFSNSKIIESKGTPGHPQRPSYNEIIEYTITIKNIGTEEVSEPFHIFHTNSAADLGTEHYSSGTLVNTEKETIFPGQSFEIKFNMPASNYLSRSKKFVINTSRKLQSENHYPYIPESNYDNNTYFY